MCSFRLTNIRRQFNRWKINFNALYLPGYKINNGSKVTSLGYNKPLQSNISNKFSFILSTNYRKSWNYFEFKAIKKLAFWNCNSVSSLIENKKSVEKPAFNNSESNSTKNGLQHNVISRNEELFEGKTVIKFVGRQNPKFILWHCFQTENFTEVDVCNRLLKIFQQSMKTAATNTTLLMNLFDGFMWNFNFAFVTANKLNFFTTDEIKKSDRSDTTRITNNTLDYRYKTANHSSKIVKIISKLLNIDPRCIKGEIFKHPKKLFVPIEQIENTHKYLKEKGYKSEVIKDHPTVLLYPREYVEKTLKFIESQHFKDNNKNIDHTDLKRRLQICVYFMEKPFHFSGEGIFPPHDGEKM